MNFVYIDKTEFEADIIAEILNSEKIYFKTIEREKCLPFFMGIACYKNYDISLNTNYEKYLFVNKLIEKKLKAYKKLEKCFNLPTYRPKDKYTIVEHTDIFQVLDDYEKTLKELEKSSLLYKLINWFRKGKNERKGK